MMTVVNLLYYMSLQCNIELKLKDPSSEQENVGPPYQENYFQKTTCRACTKEGPLQDKTCVLIAPYSSCMYVLYHTGGKITVE